MKSIIIAIALAFNVIAAFAAKTDTSNAICEVNFQSELASAKSTAKAEAETLFGSSWVAFAADWDAAWEIRALAWVNFQKGQCEIKS